MKIVSYNLAQGTQWKLERVLDMEADLYVLPECADERHVVLPQGYAMVWAGDDDLSTKGLGVVYKTSLKVGVVQEYTPIKHHLPLLVQGQERAFFLLACWPTVRNERKTYPQLLLEALWTYGFYLSRYPSLAIGDFNCYVGQRGVSKRTGTFEDCIREMAEYGMRSVYHTLSGEPFGKESIATFYWYFRESNPFFIDYAFTNIPVKHYSVGEWDKKMSDHCPQFIEL